MKFQLVAFDLDGVLVDTVSSWVWVHKHFGVNNDHSLAAYERGEIDDWEFMRRDIALWTEKHGRISIDDIMGILDSVPIMKGAGELMAGLRSAGTETAIISGGLDILAARVARELGMGRHMANGLELDDDGYLTGEGVLGVELVDKATPLKRLMGDLGVEPERCAAMGNSYIDIPMFECTGFGIAFDPHDDRVSEAADVVIKEKDLSLVIPYLI